MSTLHPNNAYYQGPSPVPPPRPHSAYDYHQQQAPQLAPAPPARPSSAYTAPYPSAPDQPRPQSSWSHLEQFSTYGSSYQPAAFEPPIQAFEDMRLVRPQSAMQSRASHASYILQQGAPLDNVVPGSVINSRSSYIDSPVSAPLPQAAPPFEARPLPNSTHRLSLQTEMQTHMAPPPRSSSLNNLSPGTPTLPTSIQGDTPQVHPYPTVDRLTQASATIERTSDVSQLMWCQDVIRLVERHWHQSSDMSSHFDRPVSPPPNSSHLSPRLHELLDKAAPLIIALSTSDDTRTSGVALYLRGKLSSSGVCPVILPKDARQAFQDFDASARQGEARSWYRLGKDYEAVNDLAKARDCYDRGAKRSECESAFRMGIAYLRGQLDLPPNPSLGLQLLHQASDTSTVDFPQSSYVYGMLLAGEISLQADIPPHLILPPSSPVTESFISQQVNARSAIERAAYLNYPPAQYKVGHMYEYAALSCPYDPAQSVAWYTFASLAGETEADMALSKWFLCGAEGFFMKNEDKARVYAEKAAKKGHLSACFALGYYFEIGMGCNAAKLGNADAPGRLAALSQANPSTMTITEHETRLRNTIIRKHTTAKNRSDQFSISRSGRAPEGQGGQSSGVPVLGVQTDFAQIPRPQPGAPIQPPIQPVSARPGEIMSPIAMSSPAPGSNFRPPMPMRQGSLGLPPSAYPPGAAPPTVPRPAFSRQNSNNSVNSYPGQSAASSVVSSAGTTHELPVPVRQSGPGGNLEGAGAGERAGATPEKKRGPQTFAEMGFVSKPVEEESCVVM
ncbi:hypothetical protein I350_07392 [Cryptococcus amylolentus CBS 6273]|uniref:Chitin synthase regulator 3 n=1 Tax=Cryptococcus amylolentus CBS 6273 TaxID=1296118 RepID=A0A1E3JED4_9TREE|nr:hypothetical protein I350_07392 [Cryptococcus amylolentus CBS 6273]